MPSPTASVDLRMFPHSFRPTASRALGGSIIDLYEAGESVRRNDVPITRATWELFLTHVKTPPDGASTSSHLRVVVAALGALNVILAHLRTQQGGDNRDLSAILNSWPAICSWLSELHRSRHQLGDTLLGLLIIAPFIANLFHWPEMAVCLQSHPRLEQVLSLLTGIWIAERDLKPEDEVDTPAAFAILVLLRCLSGGLGRVTEAPVTLFIEHFNTKQTLAKLLVVQLESAVKSQARQCLGGNANLISLVMSFDPDLRISLLSQSLTKKCIAAIESVSSQPPDRDVGDCIVSCLKCVALTLGATNGVTWVRLALRAGILSALLGCAEFYTYARLEDEAVAFLKRLICYLPYKPVIRQAHQSLEALSLKLDVEKPPLRLLSTTGKIHAIWSEFVNGVNDRRQLKDQYNKSCKYACGFPECGNSGPDMRVCQACLVVRYCSKACQKNHWRTHKLVCGPGLGTGNARGKISNEDRQFFIYLASHDILLFKAQLVQKRAAMLAQHPEFLALPFCVNINYSDYPAEVRVSPMTRNVVGEPNIAREVIASRGLRTYVEIYIPSGEEVITFPVLLEALGNWDRVDSDPPPTSVNDST